MGRATEAGYKPLLGRGGGSMRLPHWPCMGTSSIDFAVISAQSRLNLDKIFAILSSVVLILTQHNVHTNPQAVKMH